MTVVFVQSTGLKNPKPPPINYQNVLCSSQISQFYQANTSHTQLPQLPRIKKITYFHKNEVIPPAPELIILPLQTTATQQTLPVITISSSSSKTQHSDEVGSVDKSLWRARALRELPEIEQLMQRLYPVNRAESLSRALGKSHNKLNSLISSGGSSLNNPNNSINSNTNNSQGSTSPSGSSSGSNQASASEGGESENIEKGWLNKALSDIEKLNFPKEQILLLIVQHLQHSGMIDLANMICKEANIQPKKIQVLPDSRLSTLIHTTLSASDRVYHLLCHLNSQPNTTKKEQGKWVVGVGGNENGEILNKFVQHLLILGGLFKDDENIWVELMSTNPPAMQQENGEITAGSLNRLVERLTNETHYNKNYIKAFLMTHKQFTTSEILFQKLIQRYHVPTESTSFPWRPSIKLKVGNVIKIWFDDHFEDFSPSLIKDLIQFLHIIQKDGYHKLATQLEDAVYRKINGTSFSKLRPQILKMDSSKLKWPLKIHELDQEGLIRLAQQFTLIEFSIYGAIKPIELLSTNWDSPKTQHLAPNIKAITVRFNQVAFWCSSVIIKTQKLEDRVQAVTNLIKVAEHLRNMFNFQTLNSFLSSLNNSVVRKLVATFQRVPVDSLMTLNSLTEDMKKEKYKDVLLGCRGPVIPFIGYFQTDLVYVELIDDKVGDMINFNKRFLAFKRIGDILQGQVNQYKFKQIPRLHHYCSLLAERESEHEIERLSQSLEKEELRMVANNP